MLTLNCDHKLHHRNPCDCQIAHDTNPAAKIAGGANQNTDNARGSITPHYHAALDWLQEYCKPVVCDTQEVADQHCKWLVLKITSDGFSKKQGKQASIKSW